MLAKEAFDPISEKEGLFLDTCHVRVLVPPCQVQVQLFSSPHLLLLRDAQVLELGDFRNGSGQCAAVRRDNGFPGGASGMENRRARGH